MPALRDSDRVVSPMEDAPNESTSSAPPVEQWMRDSAFKIARAVDRVCTQYKGPRFMFQEFLDEISGMIAEAYACSTQGERMSARETERVATRILLALYAHATVHSKEGAYADIVNILIAASSLRGTGERHVVKINLHHTQEEKPIAAIVLSDGTSWVEIEEYDELGEQIRRWESWGIVEIAVRNQNVSDYVEHWEGRTLAAESREAKLKQELEEVKGLGSNPRLKLLAEKICENCKLFGWPTNDQNGILWHDPGDGTSARCVAESVWHEHTVDSLGEENDLLREREEKLRECLREASGHLDRAAIAADRERQAAHINAAHMVILRGLNLKP